MTAAVSPRSPARPDTRSALVGALRAGLLVLLSSAPIAAAAAAAGAPAPGGGDTVLNGDYVIARGRTPDTDLPYGGSVQVAPRHNAWTVSWRLTTGKRLRGLALRSEELFGVSFNTGGAAYGLIVYQLQGGNRWQGRWVTSINPGGALGESVFEAPEDHLAGSHHLSGRWPGAGSYEGSVSIAPRGEGGFLLTYHVGGASYRGLGVLRGHRLVVGWSFGSSPALILYEIGPDGLQGEKWLARQSSPEPGKERLVRPGQPVEEITDAVPGPAGSSAGLDLPTAIVVDPASAAQTDDAARAGRAPAGPPGEPPLPEAGPGDAAGAAADPGAAPPPPPGPDVPTVAAWKYGDLMSRYGADGRAERWIQQQLTPAQLTLLEAAVRRYRAAGREKSLGEKTLVELILESPGDSPATAAKAAAAGDPAGSENTSAAPGRPPRTRAGRHHRGRR